MEADELYAFVVLSVIIIYVWFPSFSVLQCNNHEIRPGKHIGVCISVANNRLFVGSIPKSKTKEQIVEEFAKVTGKTYSLVGFFYKLHSCHCAL